MAEIAPIHVRWFADYHAINPSWGVFHVSLGDGNYDTGAQELDEFRRGECSAEVLAMIEWFNALSPEDRERLARRVRTLELKRHQARRWDGFRLISWVTISPSASYQRSGAKNP